MALYGSLVETALGATSNSYASVAEADDYLDGIPTTYTTNWDAAGTTAEIKEDLLMWATRLLDTWVDWKGDKATTAQRLRWPRTNVSTPDGETVDGATIPQFLIEATTELARQLLAKDLTKEPTRGISRLKTGDVDITFDVNGRQRRVLLKSVQAYIHPYGTIIEGTARREAVRV